VGINHDMQYIFSNQLEDWDNCIKDNGKYYFRVKDNNTSDKLENAIMPYVIIFPTLVKDSDMIIDYYDLSIVDAIRELIAINYLISFSVKDKYIAFLQNLVQNNRCVKLLINKDVNNFDEIKKLLLNI
jgi:hypothetical protein